MATWEADSGDEGEIVSLSGSGTGSVQAEVQSASPQLVGFGFSSASDLNDKSGSRNAPGDCDDSVADTLTCTIRITVNNGALYAKDTALDIPYPVIAKLTGFSMTAVVNGIATTANVPVSDPSVSLSLGEAEPRPPTGLRATARASGQISLAWDDPVNPQIDRYEYQTSTTLNDGEIGWPTRWTNISGSGPDTVSRTVTGLTNDVTNYIRIRAVNDQSESGTRESGPSNTVEAIPNPTPAAPRNLRLSPEVTEGLNIGLLWDASSDTTITAYQVRRSADGGATWSPDWTDLPATATGSANDGHQFGTEYTFEVRAVNPVDGGAVSRITNTPTRNGVAGSRISISVSCEGNAAGAGFGDAANIDSAAYYGFDIVAAGADPTDGSQWWQFEYMKSVVDELDSFHTAWFRQDCFVPLTGAVTETIPVTWPPVVGEWSFEAGIDPNPLPSGDENGAEITFRAIYEVTSGDATELSVEITGTGSPIVTASLSENDGGNLGFGQSLDDTSTTPTGPVLQTAVCSVDLEAGTITCEYAVSGVYAKANTTPKAYGVVLDLSPNDIAFEATASNGEYQSFISATATESDIDGDGRFDLQLEVIPGLPEAPGNLRATGENSRVTLSWDNPVNPSITGYEYQQATTQPGVTLSWADPGDSTITRYQYRHTTTEPGIVLEWETPSPLVLGDFVVYEYRQTTEADTTDPANTVGNFTDVDWTPIPNSELFTTSYKVTTAEITSLDLRVTNYFEVRPVKDGSALDKVDPLTTTVEGFTDTWADIPDSGVDGDHSNSYKVTATDIPGLDLRIPNYFEVAPFTVVVGSPVTLGPLQVTDFQDAGRWVEILNSAPGETNDLYYDVTGLTNGDTYYFRIRAVTDGGPGPVSNSVAGTPELGPPAAPTGFTAVPSSGQVVLSWSDPGDSTIDRYQYRQTDNVSAGVPTWPADAADAADGDWADIPGSGSGTVDHTVTGLDDERTDAGGEVTDILYAFQVRAVNKDASDVDQPGTGSETELANPGLPLPAPTISDLTWDPSTGIIRIEWDRYTNDSGEPAWPNAEFEVSWTSDRNSGSKLVGATVNLGPPLAFLPATETEIPAGVDYGRYAFTVKARNDNGPWSAVATRDFNYPPFTEGLNPSREVDQWAEAGVNVGHPVLANLPVDSGNVATYSLNPSSSFAIDAATGQITVAGPISVGAFPVTVTASIRKPGSLDAARTYQQRITINVTSAGPWYELEKLEDSSGAAAAGDKFGNAVAVGDDGTIVVGVKDTNNRIGAVYVYDGLGDETPAKLTSPTTNAGEQFGYAVAIDGDTIVVGSTEADTTSGTGFPPAAVRTKQGTVYVFTKASGADWADSNAPTASLTSSDSALFDGFGESVAVSGDTIVVGARYRSPQVGDPPTPVFAAGAAYVFAKPTAGWADGTQTAKLEATTPVLNAAFGTSVATDGTHVFVGAPGEGRVYVFTKTGAGAVWAASSSPAATLQPRGGDDEELFGSSVAIDGRNIVIGARSEGYGAAYVFSGSGGSWSQTTRVTGLGSDSGDQFGHSVAISGNNVAVSRGNQKDNDLAGSVQVFKVNGGTPLVLTASDAMDDDLYGASVALAGDWLVVGATGVSSNKGAVYILQQNPIMDDTPGNETVRRAESDEETTVQTPDGKVEVTIPAGGRTEDYLISVDSHTGDCTAGSAPEAPGQTVRYCADVNLYDLQGGVASSQAIIGEAEVIIDMGSSRPSGFRVWKRSNSNSPWTEIFDCPRQGETGECYNTRGPDKIAIGGITSFSHYAVTAPRPTSGGGGGGSKPPMPEPEPEPEPVPIPVPVPVAPPPIPPLPGGGGGGGGGAIPPVDPQPTVLFPVFNEGASTTRVVAENSPAGTEVGSPVVARDPQGRRFSYINAGQSAALFAIDWQTGQIRVKEGTVLDFESERKSYDLVVEAVLPGGIRSIIRVTIIVTNVDEPGNVTLAPSGTPRLGLLSRPCCPTQTVASRRECGNGRVPPTV